MCGEHEHISKCYHEVAAQELSTCILKHNSQKWGNLYDENTNSIKYLTTQPCNYIKVHCGIAHH